MTFARTHVTNEMIAKAMAVGDQFAEILPDEQERKFFATLQVAATIYAGLGQVNMDVTPEAAVELALMLQEALKKKWQSFT